MNSTPQQEPWAGNMTALVQRAQLQEAVKIMAELGAVMQVLVAGHSNLLKRVSELEARVAALNARVDQQSGQTNG